MGFAMKKYFSALSSKQIIIGMIGMVVVLSMMTLAMLQGKSKMDIDEDEITIVVSIKAIAPKLKVTGKSLAKELKLSLDVNKKHPLKELNISDEQLRKVVHHLAGHTDSNAKYYICAALVLWGWIFLVIIGRPANASVKERRNWYPELLYVLALFVSVLVAGFYFGKSPNPMEGIVKIFKTMVGLYPDPMVKISAVLFFVILAIVGNKLICGWGCPFGTLQELIYKFPVLNKAKRIKMPFIVTNIIRGMLFVTVLFVLFGWIGNSKGMVIYH
jgi:RNase P/RNase MRP subunit p29